MRIRGAAGEVVVERQGPLLFVTWFDEQDERLVDAYFAEYERHVREAHEAGERFVLISDALDAKAPGATIRQRIMARTEAMPEFFRDVQIANYVVLASATVRGALTAMSWLSRTPWASEYVATPAEAIERSRGVLRGAGVDVPEEPAPGRYERPARS